MAINKMPKDGFGQIELNHVAWRRTGRIEAQCKLDSTSFAKADEAVRWAENGTLVAVDKAKGVLYHATADLAKVHPIGILYSEEHIYDERTPGLKAFALDVNSMLPRVGYLEIGDTFTTNALAYDDGELADATAVKTALAAAGTTPVYGTVGDTSGYITLTKVRPKLGLILRVVKATTMPDGQYAAKLHVVQNGPFTVPIE